MKIRLIVLGARGDVGRRIVNEALSRGHDVTAVLRRANQAGGLPPNVKTLVADVSDTAHIAALMANHDMAISAVRPPDGDEDRLASLTGSVLDAAATARVPVLVVGGAAILKLPGNARATVLTAPDYLPAAAVPIAEACAAQFARCAAETEADWSYLCPPANLSPGTRTGCYRVGTDTLLTDTSGESRISMEDFAVAAIDEAEVRRHHLSQFTVAACNTI